MYEKIYTTHKVTEKDGISMMTNTCILSDKTDTWYNTLILYTHEL